MKTLFQNFGTVLLGICLPLIALNFELNYHLCRNLYFDPFPNAWTMFLFLLVPISNAFSLFAVAAKGKSANLNEAARLLNTIASLIIGLITLAFIPWCFLSLFVFFGLLFSPFGILLLLASPLIVLGMSPVGTFMATLGLGNKLAKFQPESSGTEIGNADVDESGLCSNSRESCIA